jgi:hypothetical protein
MKSKDKQPLSIHELTKAKIGLNLVVNATTQAFVKYGKRIPLKVKLEIKEMAEAGMEEAERLGLI